MIAEMGMWVAYSKHDVGSCLFIVGSCLFIGFGLVNGELQFRSIQLLRIARFRNNFIFICSGYLISK